MLPKDNPFYDNHIFSLFDQSRNTIKWWEYPSLWFLPMLVQIGDDGMVYHYKHDRHGRYFLLKVESLPTKADREAK